MLKTLKATLMFTHPSTWHMYNDTGSVKRQPIEPNHWWTDLETEPKVFQRKIRKSTKTKTPHSYLKGIGYEYQSTLLLFYRRKSASHPQAVSDIKETRCCGNFLAISTQNNEGRAAQDHGVG